MYNQKNNIINLYANNKYNHKYFYEKNDTNLYQVINLLKIEELLYKKTIILMNKINDFKGNKIAIIFKCFLFFDLFEGGNLPKEIGLKLYNSLEMKSLFNEIINKNDYEIIKKNYYQQNNNLNSKFYIILEFKNDFIIKYFSEEKALKLGFHQKDIINKKLDILMPNSFYKSHMKIIRQKILGNQIKYNYIKKMYYFDKNKTVLYPANFEFSLIYNIYKKLSVIIESLFIFENEYSFMLENNLELIATKILNLIPEKVRKNFQNEFDKIYQQKVIRQTKSEEYFIQHLFCSYKYKDKLIELSNKRNSKKNILKKISDLEYFNKNEDEDEDDKELLIKKNKFHWSLINILNNPIEIVLHNNYSINIKKLNFIENIEKEIMKITCDGLKSDNNYNHLIISSKKLISKLKKKDLSNEYININIKLSFLYDESFYFIIINDKNKLHIKISEKLNLENKPQDIISKSKDSCLISSKNTLKENNKPKINLNILQKDLAIIEENINKINKKRFIFIIKWILSILILFIIILYLILIFYQKYLFSITYNILFAYYSIYHTEDTMMYCNSKLLQIFYDYSGLSKNDLINDDDYKESLAYLREAIKLAYFDFYDYYILYNTEIGKSYDLLFLKANFKKIKTFWTVIDYESTFVFELEIILNTMASINIDNKNTKEFNDD